MLVPHKRNLRHGCAGLPTLPGEEVRGLSMDGSGKKHRMQVIPLQKPFVMPTIYFKCRNCPVSISISRVTWKTLAAETGTYLQSTRMGRCHG